MAGKQPPTSGTSDFDPSNLVSAVADHSKDLSSLSDRVQKIEARILTHSGFADSFCESIARDVNLKNSINQSISGYIKTDPGFEKDLESVVRNIDRSVMYKYLGKTTYAVTGVLLLFLGAMLNQCAGRVVDTAYDSVKIETPQK